MNEQEVRAIFEKYGAIREGHFVYTSERHGKHYVEKRLVIENPEAEGDLKRLGKEMAARIAQRHPGVHTIVAPQMGAVELGWMVSREVSRILKRTVPVIEAEKGRTGNFWLRAPDDRHIGYNIVIVEDVITTGGSVVSVREAIAQRIESLNEEGEGGGVRAVYCLWNRGGKTARDLGVPMLDGLANEQFPSWSATPEDPCPLCVEGVEVNTDVGHGAAFLAAGGAK